MARRLRIVSLLFLVVLLLAQLSAEVLEFNADVENGGFVEPAEPLTFHAAQVGSMEVLARELAQGSDVNARNRDGWTPLLFAVEANQLHAVSLLLRKGADPNIADNDGWTPLMFAAHAGNAVAVKMLLDSKANPLLSNKEGYGAHSIAHFERFDAVSVAIATEGVIVSMLAEDFPTMLLFIKDGASVNTRNGAGWTPLIAAVSAGSTETVASLLRNPDIDVNLAENDGWTPLMFAANNNRVEITQLLLDRGADIAVISRQGFRAQGIARDRNYTEISALLRSAAARLARGEKVNFAPRQESLNVDVDMSAGSAGSGSGNSGTGDGGERSRSTTKLSSVRSAGANSAGSDSSSAAAAAAAEEGLRKALEDEKEAAKKKKTGWLW